MYVMIRVEQVGTVVGKNQGVKDNITMFPWAMFFFFFFYFFFRKKRLGGLSSLGAVLCCAVLCDDDRPVWTSGVVCSSVGLLIDSMILSHPLSYIYSSSTNMFVLFE